MSDDAPQPQWPPTPAEPEAQPEGGPLTAPVEPVYSPGPAPVAGPTQAPAKKSRKRLWITIAIVAFLLLCSGGSCAGYIIYTAVQEQAAYTRAADELEKAVDGFTKSTSDVSSEDPAAMVASVKPSVAALRTAIREARAEIEPLGDSEDKKALLEALASFDKALQKFDTVLNGMTDLGAFADGVAALGIEVEAADNATADGIDAANRKKWADAASLAATAIEKYAASETKAAELEKAWPGVGMADLQKITAIKHSAADKVAAVAKYGKSGSTSAYNRSVNEYNDLQKQLRTSKQPAILDNPDLLLADIEKAMQEVETEAQAALDALAKME